MPTRPARPRARALAVLGAIVAAVALPASGAGSGPSYHVQAQAPAGREALLEVYALDSALERARARAEALSARARALELAHAAAGRHVAIARGVAQTAERALAERLRRLYVARDTDPLEILLGSSSLDEAMTGLDELNRAARLDERVLAEASAARRRVQRLERSLEARREAVERLRQEAAGAVRALAARRAERARYLAGLRAAGRLDAPRVAAVDAAARGTTETTGSIAVSAADPVAGRRTLVVVATGYSRRGTTSSGVAAGWGIVAVDPSVIPLGTRLSIPGYGEGVAADVGAGVAGAVVDLWFPSVARARAWGRRALTITLH